MIAGFNFFSTGAECSVVCPDGRNPVLNNLKPSSKEQFDNRIECTVLQKWEPEPSYIRCVQPCDKVNITVLFLTRDTK